MSVTRVGSNGCGVVTQLPCIVFEKSTVCCPTVDTDWKYALSLLSCVGKATRTVVVGSVGPVS